MAFSGRQLSMLDDAINAMTIQRAAFEEVPITVDDILEKFIKFEDREIVQRASEMFDTKYMDRSIAVVVETDIAPSMRVTFRLANARLDGRPMFLIPHYAVSGYTREPMRISPAFERWVTAYVNNRIDFHYVKKVLRLVDDMCQHESHVAFHWPVIRILAEATGDGKLIKSLDHKTRAPLPPMPPDLRAACKETAEIVTMAHILGKAPEKKYAFNVYVSLSAATYRDTPIGVVRDAN